MQQITIKLQIQVILSASYSAAHIGRLFLIVVLQALVLNLRAQNISSTPVGFIENKGQLIDQNNKPQSKVLYLLPGKNGNLQLRKRGFSYDLYTTEHIELPQDSAELYLPEKFQNRDSTVFYFHRIDVEWIGSKRNPKVIAEGKSADFRNYYTTGTPQKGVLDVRHYQRVVYKDVWPKIDVEFLHTPKGPKFNYIVHEGGKLEDIKWRYKGANQVTMQDSAISLQTSQGVLTEHIPISYTLETADTLKISYQRKKDVYSFKGELPAHQTAIIDPVPNMIWSSYWGFGGDNGINPIKTSGNKLITGGYTNNPNTLVTTGAHQTVIGGNVDGWISSMQKNRSVYWTTFFGGSNQDLVNSIRLSSNYLYIKGTTQSYNLNVTANKFQTSLGGGTDCFVAKFKLSGKLVWSSYFGGNDLDNATGIEIYGGYIFISGFTHSINNIATTGSFAPTKGVFGTWGWEGFICKFDTAFSTKFWGTYLGGNHRSDIFSMSVLSDTSIYIAGRTNATNFGTSGAFMPNNPNWNNTLGGAYYGKFSGSGSLAWRSYIGDVDSRIAYINAIDDDVYLTTVVSDLASQSCYPSSWVSQRNHIIYSLDTTGVPEEYFTMPCHSNDAPLLLEFEDSSILATTNTFFIYSGLNNAIQNSKKMPATSHDGLILKIKNRNLVWMTYFGCTSVDYLTGLATTNDSILISGWGVGSDITITDSLLGEFNSTLGKGTYFALLRDTCQDLSQANFGNISGPVQICPFDTVNYNVNPQLYTEYYQWQLPTGASIVSGVGTACITVAFDSIGGQVSVTPRNACDTAATISINVMVLQPVATPEIMPQTDTLFLCPNDTLLLSSSISTNLLWSTGDTTTTTAIFAAGNYELRHIDTSVCGRDAIDSVWVRWQQAPDTPSVSPSGLQRICMGDSILLSASTASKYLWNTGDTTKTIWVKSPGNYSVSVKDSLLCWSFSSMQTNVAVDSLAAQPSITPQGTISICQGDSVLLTSQGTNFPLWNTGSRASAIYVKNSGYFSVSAADTNLACPPVLSDSVFVNIVPLALPPQISLAGNDTICAGDSVQLSSNVPTSNLWSTGDTTQSIWVNQAGSYFAFQLNSLQCSSDTSNAIEIVVQSPPSKPNITVNGDTNICQGDSVQLSATAGGAILWSTGQVSQSIWVSSAGTYFVHSNFQNACADVYSDSININVLPKPQAPKIAAVGDSAICNGTPVVLSSSYNTGNRWSTGDTTQSISVNNSGVVYLWRVAANGCSSDSATFQVPAADVDLGSDFSICQGETTIISAQSSGNILWSTGATGNAISVAPSATTTYWAMDANTGCSDTVRITVHPKPVAQFTATPTEGEVPLTVHLNNTSTGGTSYVWYFGNGDSATVANPIYSYQNGGSYQIQLIVTNAEGCSDTATSTLIDAFEANSIWIPNSFSPDGDGINDLFVMYGLPEPVTFSVFDRWGNRVYYSNNYQNNWDGTFNGQPLPLGVYTYLVEYFPFNKKFNRPAETAQFICGMITVQ